jgi:hypothetical protein
MSIRNAIWNKFHTGMTPMKGYKLTIETIDDDGTVLSAASAFAPSNNDCNDDAMQVAKSLCGLLRGFSSLDDGEMLESCNEDMLLLAAAVYAYGWRIGGDTLDDPDSKAFDAVVVALNAQLPIAMRSYDGTHFKP